MRSHFEIRQHTIDQFIKRYLKLKDRDDHDDEYFKSLIYHYLIDAVSIELPLHVVIRKALKYEKVGEEKFWLNRRERLLFVVIDEVVVTCYHPYDDSKRFEKRLFKGVYRRSKRKGKK